MNQEFKPIEQALPQAVCIQTKIGERFIVQIHYEQLLNLCASAKMNKGKRAHLGAITATYKGGR